MCVNRVEGISGTGNSLPACQKPDFIQAVASEQLENGRTSRKRKEKRFFEDI